MLKSLTYSSIARCGLQRGDLENILDVATARNSREGITGLLVFNGTFFMQIIEGEPEPIDRLLADLRRDVRHSGLVVFDQRGIGQRFFPDWTMELVQVERELRLPAMPTQVHQHVSSMISQSPFTLAA